jgi:hypothetical protein
MLARAREKVPGAFHEADAAIVWHFHLAAAG